MTLAERGAVTSPPLNAIPQFMIKACGGFGGEHGGKTEFFTFLLMTWIQSNAEIFHEQKGVTLRNDVNEG